MTRNKLHNCYPCRVNVRLFVTMIRCAACQDIIDNLEYLNCRRCSQKCHYLCLNYDGEQFGLLTEEYKSMWCTPNCLCKQRQGDNTNNLDRSSKLTGSSDSFVDTHRKVKNRKIGIRSIVACVVIRYKCVFP